MSGFGYDEERELIPSERCLHLNADLSICGKKNGFNMTCCCKKHFRDINLDRKESKIQDKRLEKLRGINYILFNAERSILP